MVEPRLASMLPVGSRVIVDAGSGAEHAEENMLGGLDYDASMSSPYNEVSRFRLFYPLKSINSGIELGRWRVGVSEPRLVVNRVNEMGAVGLR